MANMDKLKTPEEVHAEFTASGLSIAEWALKNGYSPKTVYDVLQRRRMGRRGEAHNVAVALGIKQGELQPANQ